MDCWRLIDSLFFSFEEMAVLCFMATLQLDMSMLESLASGDGSRWSPDPAVNGGRSRTPCKWPI